MGCRGLASRAVRPLLPCPAPSPAAHGSAPFARDGGTEAGTCYCSPSYEVVGPDTQTVLLVPCPASLLLLFLAWIPGGCDLSQFGQQAREGVCVCVSKVGVIPGPGLVSNLMWSLWPGRVINAGKSRHNEDQACCEVVYVEGRRSVSGAPREPSQGQVSPYHFPLTPEIHLSPGILGILF